MTHLIMNRNHGFYLSYKYTCLFNFAKSDIVIILLTFLLIYLFLKFHYESKPTECGPCLFSQLHVTFFSKLYLFFVLNYHSE